MAVHVLTNRYNNARTGANMAEKVLNTQNVNVQTFGKLFTRTVDGDLYAQPLVVSNVLIGGATRNVVYPGDRATGSMPMTPTTPTLACRYGRATSVSRFLETTSSKTILNFASYIGVTSTPAIEIDGHGGGTMYVVYKVRTIAQGEKLIYLLSASDRHHDRG